MNLKRSTKILTTQLSGGLGNQLFQYYAGYLYSVLSHRELMIDDFRTHESYFVANRKRAGMPIQGIRGVAKLPGKFIEASLYARIISKNTIAAKLPILKNRIAIFDLSPFGEIGTNLSINDFYFLQSSRQEIRIRGNMQSYQLVREAQKLGAPKTLAPKQFSVQVLQILKEIEGDSPVAFHLRLKDYGSINQITEFLENYYLKALNIVNKSTEPKIWIFTDEIELAKLLIPMTIQKQVVRYVEPELFTDVETLYILSKCKAIVTANSTFSYWAGIFSKSDLIIAPYPFFKAESGHSYLEFPANWKVIEW